MHVHRIPLRSSLAIKKSPPDRVWISTRAVLLADTPPSPAPPRRRRSKDSSDSKSSNNSNAVPFHQNPRKISEFLDQYVIGQDRAKRSLAVAVYNHYARVQEIIRHSDALEEYTRYLEAEYNRLQEEDFMEHEGNTHKDDPSLNPNSTPSSTSTSTSSSSSSSHTSTVLGKPPHPSSSSSSRNDKHQNARESLLTDFIGQTTGSEYPPLSSPSSSSSSSSSSRPYLSQIATPPRPSPNPMVNVEKSNVLLIGPTGTGKTLLARTLAKSLDVPFVSVEATPFTQAGYVGEDVESCVQRLVQAAGYDMQKASVGIIHIDEVDKLSRRQDGHSKDVSGEGVQQGLLRILEGSMVQVSDKGFPGGMINSGSPGSGPGPGPGRGSTRDGLPHGPMSGNGNGAGGPGGGKGESYFLDTSNILFILSGAFVGLEKVIKNRIAKASIGFNAPLKTDKLTGTGKGDKTGSVNKRQTPNSTSPSSHYFTRNDTQSMFAEVIPKDLIDYGLIPEFVGRLPMVTTLDELSEEDLLRVLTIPRNALVKQYEALFAYSHVDLKFTTPALLTIARQAKQQETGARGLRRIMENLLLDAMYEAPHSSIKYVLIDKAVADGSVPAKVYSRGEKSLFQNAYSDDEESRSCHTSGSQISELDDSLKNNNQQLKTATG